MRIKQKLQPQSSCQAAGDFPYLATRTGTLSAMVYVVLAQWLNVPSSQS
jgi:hypothetical protein